MSNNLLLFRLVWFNDHETLTQVLNQEKNKSIIEEKFRGMTALHLAIQLNHPECVKTLLVNGADTLALNDLGFLPLQEATSLGDRNIMKQILITRHNQIRSLIKSNQPEIHRIVTQNLEDFYMEMNWEFQSWVPFLSYLCPSDCYKIWKKGSNFRVDTTLIGFDKLRWLRGNVSFLFSSALDSSFYLLDHDRCIYDKLSQLEDYTLEDIENDLNMRLNSEIVSAKLNSGKPIKFSRARSVLGLGSEMTERVDGRKTKVYNIEHVEWISKTRKEHLRDHPNGDMSEETSSWFLGYGGRSGVTNRKLEENEEERKQKQKEQKDLKHQKQKNQEIVKSNDETRSFENVHSLREIREKLDEIERETFSSDEIESDDNFSDFNPNRIDNILDDAKKLAYIYTPSLPAPPQTVPFEEFFPEVGCTRAELPYIHVGRPLALKEHKRKIKASVWMSNDFPITIPHLLPFFQLLSPSSEHFERLQEFIMMELPPGFPIQIEIPVLIFLSARITFRNYKPWTRQNFQDIPVPKNCPDSSKDDQQNCDHAYDSWFEIPSHYKPGIVIKNIFKKYEDDL